MGRWWGFVLALLSFGIHFCNSLECYVCKDQDGNNGKCLQTIMTCQAEEDQCMTEIRWGTTPYWQAGAEKQFYIGKKCATKQQCEKTMKKTMPYCTHVWYEDWRCSECCGGDRCNYYVISGSPFTTVNSWTLSLLVAVLVGGFQR